MNATKDSIDVKTKNQSAGNVLREFQQNLHLPSTPSDKMMNPLTRKPSTQKEVRGGILCWSYAQTLMQPVTDKQKNYSPLLIFTASAAPEATSRQKLFW
jgi:hypothetical protein